MVARALAVGLPEEVVQRHFERARDGLGALLRELKDPLRNVDDLEGVVSENGKNRTLRARLKISS